MTETVCINNNGIIEIDTHWSHGRWFTAWMSHSVVLMIVEDNDRVDDCIGREEDWIGLKYWQYWVLHLWLLKLITNFQ